MLGNMIQKLGLSLDLEKEERSKILWLAFAFFCLIGAYTVIKEMKDVLFSQIVGAKHMADVKFISMFIMLPLTLIYAKLVDRMSRFKLLVFYSMIYGIGGLVVAYFLSDPVMGIANSVPSPDRTFGWFIYLFYEGMVPFVVSVFWSFANSVTKPETAKKGYTVIIAGSKLGGMFTAGTAWFMFTHVQSFSYFALSSTAMHQVLLVAASLMLAVSPVVIYMLLQRSSEKSLHGYEAVYKLEKEQEKKGESNTGMLSGLTMFGKYPYLLGIFGMMFFYELVNVVLGIQRAVIMQAISKDVAAFTGGMFAQRFVMHGVGLMISFFGTRILIKRFGERVCLLLIPIIMGLLVAYFMIAYNEQAVLIVFTALGMLNYAFASPLREALYIPTVKDIRFKSKSWIESFGQRFAKGSGTVVIKGIQSVAAIGSPLYMGLFSAFFSVVIVLWTAVSYVLGKKYADVVKNKQVIGGE